ncbi:NAD(P)-dependent oxidoreductase [Frigoribacterium sp. ACAM 257]|uniref:NAD-dependent epimerase/dehydratase family protein n=1 Tax=Frigoribacterium sp. ACAM 257 TaxID=2508998 RepID=UPI00174A3FBE|nr:NAD-dependent epimerase/dehydratase family protein [Frigoribacterium sp. ACAM 257]
MNDLSSYAGRRILVTGAAGFIGSALVPRLLQAGATVVGIDIRQGYEGPGYEHRLGDAANLTAAELAEVRPDMVVHLASVVGVVAAASDPAATRRAILGMTTQFVDLVESLSGVRFVYVSSSEVYGQSTAFPLVEKSPLAPLSAYGQAKRDAEELVSARTAAGRLDGIVVRPFNVYGPGQRTDFVVTRFVEQALSGDDLTVVDSGDQLRTFTYVDDFVEGLLRAAAHDGDERLFNISGHETWTIGALASAVVDLAGSASSIVSTEPADLGRPREIEVENRVASCGRARRVLGYQPRVGVLQGIGHCIDAAAEASVRS